MSDVLSVLGCGNMAQAMLSGLAAMPADARPFNRVVVFDVDPGKCVQAQEKFGAEVAQSTEALMEGAKTLLLCIKPQVLNKVSSQLQDHLPAGASVISVVAAVDTQSLRYMLGEDIGVLRVMPNLPMAIGKGAAVLSLDYTISDTLFEKCKAMFSAMGSVFTVPDHLMDAITAVSCTPAFVYMFIEALADGGVRLGLDRKTAQDYAAQVVLGAAGMVLSGTAHPGALKDAVCSPGGVTIDGVLALEERAFRGAVMDAIAACADKVEALSSDS